MQLAYRPGHTFFHKVDPLTKLTWVFVVAIWLFSLSQIDDVLYVVAGTIFLAIAGARIHVYFYLRLSFIVFFGGLFLVVFQGLFRPGEGINLGPITLSYSGMNLGFALAFRTFGLVASSLVFSNTTSPQDLELSLVKIGIPYKNARIFYLALRFLPVFYRDLQHINDAQELRGVKGGRRRTQSSMVALIATELRQADNVAIALETRGFGLHSTRTELRQIETSTRGVLLVGITVSLMLFHFWIIHA